MNVPGGVFFTGRGCAGFPRRAADPHGVHGDVGGAGRHSQEPGGRV